MLGAKKPNYERPTTVIGKDTLLTTAMLESKSSVQINGVLTGDANVDSSLVIGQEGKVNGNITASFILVAGTIEGNVNATEQLHVTKSAVINGDILCGSIIIDDGAMLNGNCKMDKSEAAAKKGHENKNSGKEVSKELKI